MPNPKRKIREAIVLAGGFGTRLSKVVSDIPKPMAPVAGRPFLRYILDQLAAAGIRRVVVADGYKREVIEEYFGAHYRGMELMYSPEDKPLLTGGAVKQALQQCNGEWVFVVNGDTFLEIDYDSFEEDIAAAQADIDAMIACIQVASGARYGALQLDSTTHTITAFGEKATDGQSWINGGVYALRLNALAKMPVVFSLEQDYFEPMVASGCIGYHQASGLFIDIGIPEDYERAQGLLAPFAQEWRIAFFDRDGTINVDTGHLHEPDKLELIESTLPILKRYSDSPDWKVVVVTNQAGIAKGMYTGHEMHSVHERLDEMLAEHGILIDAYYYCPHHPDFTGECDCRKPKPGMLLAAMRDFDAKYNVCCMIGDNKTDLEAALQAGICSDNLILVG